MTNRNAPARRMLDDEVRTPLLDIECSRLLKDENGITTITFYRGDRRDAMRRLRERMALVVAANPWLAGRLIQDKSHRNAQLSHPRGAVTDAVLDELFHPDPDSVRIGSEMPYAELSKRAESAVVRKGTRIINKADRVCRLTVTADANRPDGFALVFSLSHMVTDGYTFYRILNALFETGPVSSMTISRNQEASSAVVDAVGKPVYKYLFSLPLILNVVKGMLFGRKVQVHAFFVDPERIAASKRQAVSDPTGGTAFVSTNDVLTSSFARAVPARLCMMAVDFRGRIPGIGPEDAGNYDGALLFDDEVSRTPSGIRKALVAGAPYQTTTKRLPGLREGATCRMGLITNWSSFAGDHSMQGAEPVLHLPLYDPRTFPFDCAVIFTPAPGRTAVMYFAKHALRQDLLSRCELGQTVSASMFKWESNQP